MFGRIYHYLLTEREWFSLKYLKIKKKIKCDRVKASKPTKNMLHYCNVISFMYIIYDVCTHVFCHSK